MVVTREGVLLSAEGEDVVAQSEADVFVLAAFLCSSSVIGCRRGALSGLIYHDYESGVEGEVAVL